MIRQVDISLTGLTIVVVGVAITILSRYVYSLERECWCGYTKTSITLLVGIAIILIGIAGLIKTKRRI